MGLTLSRIWAACGVPLLCDNPKPSSVAPRATPTPPITNRDVETLPYVCMSSISARLENAHSFSTHTSSSDDFASEGGDFADPGDWGGVVLLGRAPINLRDGGGRPIQGQVEGILTEADAAYGGDDPEDSSGSLQYVRIEYGGKAIAPNNELNGLTLAGVGRGTVIDHVMVRQTTDDCFEFFGGTVDAKPLLCQAPGDDGFDWDLGYTGRLQFLVLQQDPLLTAEDRNGFEGDNDPAGSSNMPVSEPTIYNVTLCGHDYDAREQYGALLRKGTRANIFDVIVSGFEAGVDVRDAVGPTIELRSSIFFGNTQLAYLEDAAAPYNDDDGAFDEIGWINNPANSNATSDPRVDCNNAEELRLSPSSPITANAAAPPDDGFFDSSASYVGAFRDAEDDWASGSWVVWRPN